MTINASIIVAGLCALLFSIAALRAFRRRRIAGGLMLGTGGLLARPLNQAARAAIGAWRLAGGSP